MSCTKSEKFLETAEDVPYLREHTTGKSNKQCLYPRGIATNQSVWLVVCFRHSNTRKYINSVDTLNLLGVPKKYRCVCDAQSEKSFFQDMETVSCTSRILIKCLEYRSVQYFFENGRARCTRMTLNLCIAQLVFVPFESKRLVGTF